MITWKVKSIQRRKGKLNPPCSVKDPFIYHFGSEKNSDSGLNYFDMFTLIGSPRFAVCPLALLYIYTYIYNIRASQINICHHLVGSTYIVIQAFHSFFIVLCHAIGLLVCLSHPASWVRLFFFLGSPKKFVSQIGCQKNPKLRKGNLGTIVHMQDRHRIQKKYDRFSGRDAFFFNWNQHNLSMTTKSMTTCGFHIWWQAD